MRKLFLICLLALFCAPAFSAVTATTSASGASATTVTLTPDQARQALQVLNDPRKRAQIEDTLNAIAAAGVLATPAAPASGASSAAAAGSASAASATAAFKSNGLASQLVRQGARGLKQGGMTLKRSIAVLLDTESARSWWDVQLSDPHERAKVFGVLLALIGTLLPAIALEWLARRLLRRARAAIIARREAREARDKAREAATAMTGAPATAAATASAGPGAAAAAAAPAQPAVSMSTPPSSSASTGASGTTSGKPDSQQKEARSKRQAQHHWTTLQRLPSAALQLVLRMLPLVVFVAAASALMSFFTDDGTTQDAALNGLIDLYVICRAIVIAAGFFLQPDAPGLRLLRLPDSWALFMQRWVTRVVSVIGAGGALIEIATALGLSDSAHLPLVKLLALVGHVMVSIMILQCRAPISALLRERTSDSSVGSQRPVTMLAHGLIDMWAWVAVFIVMALWFVWALDVHNGYRTLLHLGGLSLAVLVGARVVSIVLFGALGRLFRAEETDENRSLIHQHAYRYYPLIRRVVSALVVVVSALVLLQVWGLDVWQFFRPGAIGHRLTSAFVTICVAAVIALVVWEIANVSVEKRLAQWTSSGDLVRAARLRTLVPMLRTALFVAIALVVVLTGLSELGVNTAPLLASASIFGVALGFGSQKLVQDFITGIFLLMENAMQVGDWVTLAGVSGTVEYLSIRTVRLRGGDGSLFTVPFSSVSTVNNTNRGLGNAAVRVSIAYGQDVDLAIATLKEIGASLREDEQFKAGILSDFSFWGVDAVDGAAVTLAGQIQCRDTARWPVQREFNRRIFDQFRAQGIEIANPQRSMLVSSNPARGSAMRDTGDDELEGPPRPANAQEGAQPDKPAPKAARH